MGKTQMYNKSQRKTSDAKRPKTIAYHKPADT